MDVISHHFNGELHSSNVWNAFHQVVATYNALGEGASFEYNANHQITMASNAAGLIFEFTYTDGFLDSILERSATTNFGTTTFTWTNGTG